MFTVIRIRSFVALTLLAALLVAGLPRSAGAAGSPQISTSTYQSGQWCDVVADEDICAIKSGGGTWTLLKISGKNFTKGGIGLVTITNVLTMTTVSSGTAVVNGSGNFVFKTQDVVVCSGGTPLFVQVYDIIKQQNSNLVAITACKF